MSYGVLYRTSDLTILNKFKSIHRKLIRSYVHCFQNVVNRMFITSTVYNIQRSLHEMLLRTNGQHSVWRFKPSLASVMSINSDNNNNRTSADIKSRRKPGNHWLNISNATTINCKVKPPHFTKVSDNVSKFGGNIHPSSAVNESCPIVGQ